MSSSQCLGSVFILKKEATTPIFNFKKKQKLNEKNSEKDFLLDIAFILNV